jgi:hypothetical protein
MQYKKSLMKSLVCVVLIQLFVLCLPVDIGNKQKGVFCELQVDHLDRDGNVIETRIKKGDLILRNLAYGLIDQFRGSVSPTYTKTYITGGTFTVPYVFYPISPVQIMIGTGVTPPTITQYSCQTLYATDTISASNRFLYTTSGNDMNITAIGYFLCATTADISEVCMVPFIYEESTGGSGRLVITRDTFTPIHVLAGEAISVYVKIIINQ